MLCHCVLEAIHQLQLLLLPVLDFALALTDLAFFVVYAPIIQELVQIFLILPILHNLVRQ